MSKITPLLLSVEVGAGEELEEGDENSKEEKGNDGGEREGS